MRAVKNSLEDGCVVPGAGAYEVAVHLAIRKGLNELKGDAAAGQFWSEDTYVVRWKYKVSLTGRDLKGRPSKHVAVGRERYSTTVSIWD